MNPFPSEPGSAWGVGELTAYLGGLLQADPFLSNLWVKGEISNFKYHSSGHMYFTIKDREAAIRCVMFRGQNSRLSFHPESGMEVLAQGGVRVYARDGQYQLYVQQMLPYGLGALFVGLEQLRRKLAGEGLFDPERKRPLPFLPEWVGVVTSRDGAAWRDIQRVAGNRFPPVRLLLAPAAVQGEGAPVEIARAIERLNKDGRPRVIIVGRGGGSVEELWAFNAEAVVRAVAKSVVPVVSAVGHETDFTLCDMAADRRASTPSAAAEMVVPSLVDLWQFLDSQEIRLAGGIKRHLVALQGRVESLASRPVLTRPDGLFAARHQHLAYLERLARREMSRLLKSKEEALGNVASRLQALSPLATLGRGYSLASLQDGSLVRSTSQVKVGDALVIAVSDGEVDCTVSGKRGDCFDRGEES